MKSILAFIGFCVVVYAAFFIPLGDKTFVEHVRRIAKTDEAQELERDARDAAGRLRDDVERELDEHDASIPPPRL